MENVSSKERLRLTPKAELLIEEVRRGSRSYEGLGYANFLWSISRNPDYYLDYLGRANANPVLQGDISRLLNEGFLEVYKDSGTDLLEKYFPKKPEEEYTDKRLRVSKKGYSLMSALSSLCFDLVLPEKYVTIGSWLFKWEEDPDTVPAWIMINLAESGYLERYHVEEDEEFVLAPWV